MIGRNQLEQIHNQLSRDHMNVPGRGFEIDNIVKHGTGVIVMYHSWYDSTISKSQVRETRLAVFRTMNGALVMTNGVMV